MSDEFKTWLSNTLEERGWSYRELARRMELDQSRLSRVLSGKRKATVDFYKKVADALGEAPEKVLRLAGILSSEDDSVFKEAVDMLRNLTPQQQQEALRYIRYLYQSRPEDH